MKTYQLKKSVSLSELLDMDIPLVVSQRLLSSVFEGAPDGRGYLKTSCGWFVCECWTEEVSAPCKVVTSPQEARKSEDSQMNTKLSGVVQKAVAAALLTTHYDYVESHSANLERIVRHAIAEVVRETGAIEVLEFYANKKHFTDVRDPFLDDGTHRFAPAGAVVELGIKARDVLANLRALTEEKS